MTRRLTYRLVLAAGLLVLAACSSTPEDRYIEPADVLYRDARESLDSGNFLRAETQLQQIMSRYPFTDFAVQAHLDMLFVLLQTGEPERLSEEADRFIRENPRHPDIDYVHYMKGLAFYQGLTNPVRELVNVDVARQDVQNAETGFRNFAQLVSRFPESRYAADARLRMIELRNRIARHQIHIADYYLRRGAWVSALQRAYRVLEELQGTPAETDALMVMERAYTELGLDDLAATPRQILAANPDREPVVLKQQD